MPEVMQGCDTPVDPSYILELPGTVVFAPVVLLVYEILLGGVRHLSTILRRPELANETMRDPEVQGLLRTLGLSPRGVTQSLRSGRR